MLKLGKISILLAFVFVGLLVIGATCEEEPEAEPGTSAAANSMYNSLDADDYRGLAIIAVCFFIAVVVLVIVPKIEKLLRKD